MTLLKASSIFTDDILSSNWSVKGENKFWVDGLPLGPGAAGDCDSLPLISSLAILDLEILLKRGDDWLSLTEGLATSEGLEFSFGFLVAYNLLEDPN